MSRNFKGRVFLGMSGGVDSSVSAALLKKAGYDVVGVFIRVWEPAGFVCNWREERRWARRVAAHLDIPLLTLDLSQEYKQRVVDYFISEYKAGRTPNPDVMCNKHIKFGIFYDWAMDHGANFVATGHYAQIIKNNLVMSKDQDKDQTYFLWNLKTEQLPKILFPVGKYTKPEVRKLATKFKLPTALKKDSQGLCFVGKIDFKDFLKREIKEKRGNVLDEQGNIIGKHMGAFFFTIGERRGFEISAQANNTKPFYVVKKDVEKNTLTVSNQIHLGAGEVLSVNIENLNIFKDFKLNTKLKARVRHRQPPQDCQIIKMEENQAVINFSQPQLATPGQSLVLYDKNICLGGGIIT